MSAYRPSESYRLRDALENYDLYHEQAGQLDYLLTPRASFKSPHLPKSNLKPTAYSWGEARPCHNNLRLTAFRPISLSPSASNPPCGTLLELDEARFSAL